VSTDGSSKSSKILSVQLLRGITQGGIRILCDFNDEAVGTNGGGGAR
jgi:hypothetical protein